MPSLPREVLVASRISLDGLRPWEYWDMGFWDYERVAHAQDALRSAQRTYPPGWDVPTGGPGREQG